MKWILIVFIFTGEHHKMETTVFATKEDCTAAAHWVNGDVGSSFIRDYKPKANCFRSLTNDK